MEYLISKLNQRQNEIKVGIIGIGSIGKGLVLQCHITPGFKPVAICDIDLEKAESCAKWLGLNYKIVDSVSDLNTAITKNILAVCEDAMLLCSSDKIETMIEASGDAFAGAKYALRAIEHNQHIIMMNYETDSMYGPLLMKKAEGNNLVYTCADGDQPAIIKKLVDDLLFWGFDLVMAGNIKGYLDRYTNPVKIAPEADKRSMDHKMCSSYTDGSKLCVEMASVANALDLRTHVPGMYGYQMDSVHEVFDYFDFEEIYKDKKPVVDYILGARPKGGLFAIAYTEDEFQRYTLDWLPPEFGTGPFYLFYRPFLLGHIEALNCVAEAVLFGGARLKPEYGIKTNVFCYAKKDLKAGDTLDGMGGFNCYGLIENINDNKKEGVPICISDNVVLKKSYKKDERILLKDVDFKKKKEAFNLYFETLKA